MKKRGSENPRIGWEVSHFLWCWEYWKNPFALHFLIFWLLGFWVSFNTLWKNCNKLIPCFPRPSRYCWVPNRFLVHHTWKIVVFIYFFYAFPSTAVSNERIILLTTTRCYVNSPTKSFYCFSDVEFTLLYVYYAVFTFTNSSLACYRYFISS